MFAERTVANLFIASLFLYFSSVDSAFATQQLEIIQVHTNLENRTMTIRGRYLNNGDDLAVWLGGRRASVIYAKKHKIKAKLPDKIMAGDFLLRVKTGPGSRRTDTFDVTVVPNELSGPGAIIGFYSAAQDSKLVQPGAADSVRSTCDPGDYAVSGSVVTQVIGASSGINAPDFYFRVNGVGLVIDGVTGEQSWVLSGVNESPAPLIADIRVSARCADVAN